MKPVQNNRVIYMWDDRNNSDAARYLTYFARTWQQGIVVLRGRSPSGLQTIVKHWQQLPKNQRPPAFIANEWRLALRNGCGLHCSEQQARCMGTFNRRLWRKKIPLSVACHTLPAIRRGLRLQADILLISPILPTTSHENYKYHGYCYGRSLLRAAHGIGIPLGGMNRQRCKRLSSTRYAATRAFEAQ